MKQFTWFLLLAFLQSNTLPTSSVVEEKRFSHIVGNGNYVSSKLPNAVNDPQDFTISINGVNVKMVYVQGGTFEMGSNEFGDAEPIHSVTLTDYHIAESEVTQELYEAVMGSNPSGFEGKQRPVEQVNWHDAQAFIQKVNEIIPEGTPLFHLPTEAQWEYAARGGKQSKGYKYAGSNELNDIAWYYENSYDKGSDYGTHPVKGKQANELGLFDMSGNVWEWCLDDYAGDAYAKAQSANITNPVFIDSKITKFDNNTIQNKNRANITYACLRGGSWFNSDGGCAVAHRTYNLARNDNGSNFGFRLCRTP